MGILNDDPRIKRLVDYLEHLDKEELDLMDMTKALAGTGVNTNPHIEFLVRVMTCDL